MEKADAGGKGTVVLATVRGDVHDIGKNLVDIILTNNGYTVYNLGIKITIAEMIDKALEVDADAIGMSGLLVKSTVIMRENLEELNERGLAERVPVLLGGAALTRNYVEVDLRETYEGRVFYGKDAFEGLRTMDTLMDGQAVAATLDPAFGREAGGRKLPPRKSERADEGGRDPRALRRRDRRARVHAAVRRVPRRQGHLARRDRRATSTRPRCSATSGSSAPRRRGERERRRVQGAHPADAARPARHRAQGRAARSRGRVGLLRRERRRQRPRRVEGRHADAGVAAVRRSRGSARRRSTASPTSSGRVESGEPDYAGVPRRDDGPASRASARRSCSPPTSTRTTCCCTACRSR